MKGERFSNQGASQEWIEDYEERLLKVELEQLSRWLDMINEEDRLAAEADDGAA